VWFINIFYRKNNSITYRVLIYFNAWLIFFRYHIIHLYRANLSPHSSLLSGLLIIEIGFFWALNIRFYCVLSFAESDTLAIHICNIHDGALKSQWNKIRQQITQRSSKRFRFVRLKVDKSAGYYMSLPPASSDLSNRSVDTCELTYMHRERGSRSRIPRAVHKYSWLQKEIFRPRHSQASISTDWIRFN